MSEEDDFSKLSVVQRWRHAKWKARQSAYADAQKSLNSEEGIEIINRLDDLKAAASDSNVIALEAGVNLITALAQALSAQHQPQAVALRRTVALSLAEKGLSAAKPSVKQSAANALIALVQVADPQGVVDDLLPVLDSKSAKLVVNTLGVLTTIFDSFGGPVAKVGVVAGKLPKMFAHNDKNVRNGASQLAVALCRWTGQPAMMKQLASLKPVQLTDLEPQFTAVCSTPFEAKLMTRQQEEALAQTAANQDDGVGMDIDGMGNNGDRGFDQEAEAELDPWEQETPQDIVSKLPSNFYEQLRSPKWKERGESLNFVKDKLESMPRLDPNTNYGELVSALQIVVEKDANQMCAIAAIHAIGSLAAGLRQAFAQFAPRCIEAVMERFRKPAFIPTVHTTLNALFKSLGMKWSSILDPLLPYLSHKMPAYKQEASKYIFSLLCEAETAPSLQEMKQIADASVNLLADSAEPVRSAAANVLGALEKIFGMPKMASIFDPLDEHKKKKIQSAFETCTVKAKSEPQTKRPAKRPGAAGAARGNPMNGGPSAGPTGGRPGRPQSFQPPSRPNGAVRPSPSADVAQSASPQSQHRLSQRPPTSASQTQQTRPRLSQLSQAGQAGQAGQQPASVMSPNRLSQPGLRPGRAPRTPIATRPGQRVAGNDSFEMELERSSEASDVSHRQSVPLLASTPKIAKRNVRTAEFTPARFSDAKGRRLYSPAVKPGTQAPNMHHDSQQQPLNQNFMASTNRNSVEAASSASAGVEQVAKYMVLYENEQRRTRELEQQLASFQVQSDRRIYELEQEIASLKLQCEISVEERRLMQEKLARSHAAAEAAAAAPIASRDVHNRLSNLSLASVDTNHDPYSRPQSRARSALRFNNHIVPLDIQRPAESSSFDYIPDTGRNSNSESYNRAIEITKSLRQRVQDYKNLKRGNA